MGGEVYEIRTLGKGTLMKHGKGRPRQRQEKRRKRELLKSALIIGNILKASCTPIDVTVTLEMPELEQQTLPRNDH